jgi:cytochrome P450
LLDPPSLADPIFQDLSNQVDKVKEELKQGVKPGRPTVFHEMLGHDLPAEEFAQHRMRDEAQTVVGAGLTTTAWSLSNGCFYLIENKEAQEKLRKELVEAIADIHAPDAFNYRKLESLPYLRGCVKESIRMGTGVSGRNNRIWKSPLPYRDWIIPAGTSVSMNHQDVLFDKDIFPDPRELVPERWIGNPKAPDGSSLERYFVPFGKGDRQCLGIK